MVSKAKVSDSVAIAHIHYTQLNLDFLSSLGETFLEVLYKILINNKKINVFVYKEENKVLGFITGSINFDEQFRKTIFNNFLTLSFSIIPNIIRKPYLIKKIFKTFFYITSQPESEIKAELISVAVNDSHQRKGIGKKLLKSLEVFFKKNKIGVYKVSTNKSNLNANLFYKSLGFKKKGEYSLYNKKVNLYIKKI